MALSIPQGVSAIRGGGLPLEGFKRKAFYNDRPEAVQVDKGIEFAPIPEGSGCGHDRIFQVQSGNRHIEIWGGCPCCQPINLYQCVR